MSDTSAVATANVWKPLGASLLVGALVFVLFVLPAEFDRDPTGFGELTGIKGMAGYSVSALTLTGAPPQGDEVRFPLAPFESVEYKYELAAGQAVVYSWVADGEVLFDFHSEAEGTDPEDAVSFSVGRGDQEHGTYVAPYAGIHGWFWENRGEREVEVVLKTQGFYTASITYSAAGEYRRAFDEQ